jgi:hypothetical protein
MSRTLLLLLPACAPQRLAPPAEREGGARDAEDVLITFSADWTEQISGPVVEGATVRVLYDPARLTQCRGKKYGYEAWAINASWRVNGGPVQSFPIVMQTAPSPATFVVPEAGELELWFVNSDAFGCVAYDSDYGANYRYPVLSSVVEPDWMGEASVAISRATCDGGPCDADLRPLSQGFLFDTWARQRAAISSALFRVWEPGVTDWDNPQLWEELDVRVHWRASPEHEFAWDWVDFDQRVGNDARYEVSLRELDPLPGATVTDPADCPDFPVAATADGQYLEATLELYFSVNGHELRQEDGSPFVGRYQDYIGLYALCLE